MAIAFNAAYSQFYTVTSTKFTKAEGSSQGFINVKYSAPAMSHTMSVNYTITGKSSGAVVSSDLSNITPSSGTITFAANDSTEQVTFNVVMDNVTEGNGTFLFKLVTGSGTPMGTVGTPDSVLFIIRDSVAAPITGRPYYTIATVRGNNTGGIPDSVAKGCTLRGVLYGVNWKNPGYQMSLCDGTGCIGIFSTRTYAIYPTAKEGDSVEISGYIEEFRGLGQINFSSTSGDTIRLLDNKPIKSPVIVSTLDEYSESRLVQMDNLVLSSGTWLADSSFNLKMKNASGTEFSIRISNKPSTNFSAIPLIKTGEKYSITGLGGQFDPASSTPKTTGYQLIPRKSADIVKTGVVTVGIKDVSGSDFSVYPSIVDNKINVSIQADVNENGNIHIIDMQGRILMTQAIRINNGENLFTVSNLNTIANGNYMINIISESINLTKQFIINK